MISRLIHIDTNADESLQSQIRRHMLEGIFVGSFAGGMRLPSSRKLAVQLGVSRNTVMLVYQALIDEGYIISRERSGIYVSDNVNKSAVMPAAEPYIGALKVNDNSHRFKGKLPSSSETSCPTSWREFSYPFIDGKYDSSLYPVKEWRDANSHANATHEIYQWSELQGTEDDPMLLDEIRTKILPRRGIQASREEIMITSGSQQALNLVVDLFVDASVTVAVEEPGFPEMRELLQRKSAQIVHQPVDGNGIEVSQALDGCDIVYTTPSHQTPTSVTMSMARRDELLSKARQEDLLIIEDDFEFESNFLGQPHPALRSLDKDNRVIYVSCLSKVMASGIQIGFVVAEASVIAELKKLRKLAMRNPAFSNQRSVAYFLSLGHYNAFMMHIHKIFFERWLTLREAMNTYLPNCVDTGENQGGTSYWVTGPKELDGEYLQEKAAEIGILIEPVKRYFALSGYPENCFRMGITSIPNDKIRSGVAKLAQLILQLTEEYNENLSTAKGRLLSHDVLAKVLNGAQLECQMVYGVPCEIDLLDNGVMLGRTGGKDNEADMGRWWVEDGQFYRQWNEWSYGEVKGFYVIMDGDEMKWFDRNYRFVRQLELKGYVASHQAPVEKMF
jgi:GntR family transcriptional regulator/MocR family aminotransferase